MVSVIGRKRVRAGNGSMPRRFTYKKRRFVRRRRFNRRRTQAVTNRASGAINAYSRPLTRRRIRQFRRNLWIATDVKQKFKSILAIVIPTTITNLQTVVRSITVTDALDESTPFWTAAGGLRPTHFAGAVPSLNPESVFLRGGTCSLSLSYGTLGTDATSGLTVSEVDALRLTVQLVYVKQQKRNFTDANNVSPLEEWTTTTLALWPRATGSKLQDEADYEEYYHMPIIEKSALFRPGDSLLIEHKLKPKRVDADQFNRGFKMFPRWIIYFDKLSATDNTQPFINIVKQYRLMFTVNDI